MAVPAKFFASPLLLNMVVSEAQASSSGSGGFVASLQQLSNVATSQALSVRQTARHCRPCLAAAGVPLEAPAGSLFT